MGESLSLGVCSYCMYDMTPVRSWYMHGAQKTSSGVGPLCFLWAQKTSSGVGPLCYLWPKSSGASSPKKARPSVPGFWGL